MLREHVTTEWFTILIVFCLCLLAIGKVYYSKRFSDFIGLLTNSNYLNIYQRDQKFIDQFDALLFVNFVISSSIFGFIGYDEIINNLEFEPLLFFKIAILVAGTILIKVLIERLIGSIFEIDELMDAYLFQKTNYKNLIGIVLLVFNVILLFGIKPFKWLLLIMFGLIVILGFIGFFGSVQRHQKLLLGNTFYFILYLCALEIGPYVLLYKFLLLKS